MEAISHILAFLLPVGLFLFWGVLGFAILSCLYLQRNVLKNLLLAPIVGLSTNLLFVFWLSRMGFPVSLFAMPMGIILLVTAALVLYWQKPVFSWKIYLPFTIIFLIALFLVGHPLLQFGFNWVSFVNDDMTNYSLMALRFLNHGYFDIPNLNDMINGRDYSLYYWFFHVPRGVRSGSDLILAFVSGITTLNPTQIFMPTILAFHLILISTTGALTIGKSSHHRMMPLIACLLIAFSALTGLGTISQLIAQVGGLSLLACSLILLLSDFKYPQLYQYRMSILLAIVCSALIIVYPELIPFLMLTYLVCIIGSCLKGWRFSKQYFKILVVSSLLIVLFTNTYLVGALLFLFYQTKMGSLATPTIIFPYYLVPSGLAYFWGLQALGSYPPEPIMSLTILFGMFLSIGALFISLWVSRRFFSLASIVTIVMIAMGYALFLKKIDFGLFKIAMYIQPFLIATLAIAIYKLIKNSKIRVLLITLILSSNIFGLNYYVTRSLALQAGSLSEVPYATQNKIVKEFTALIRKVDDNKLIIWNDFNLALFKLESANAGAKRLYSTQASDFAPRLALSKIDENNINQSVIFENTFKVKKSKQLAKEVFRASKYSFDLKNDTGSKLIFLEQMPNIDPENTLILNSVGKRTTLNNFAVEVGDSQDFKLMKWNDTHNNIEFICSSLSQTYLGRIKVGLFNVEEDLFYHDKVMQGIGRYLLFRVYNPTDTFRLALSITNSLNADGVSKIYPAELVGNQRVTFSMGGRGSARVFSPPLSPQLIHNHYYILLDMGADSFSFEEKRTGLMKLYNRSLITNTKYITAFARDISVITEEQYQNLQPPTKIENFPEGLANKNLEYSGIYEDGWIAEESFFRLKQTDSNNYLLIKGSLPDNKKDSDNRLSIELDGEKLAEKDIVSGDFEFLIPIPNNQPGNKKIALHFKNVHPLSEQDKRPAAALMKFIGFVDKDYIRLW